MATEIADQTQKMTYRMITEVVVIGSRAVLGSRAALGLQVEAGSCAEKPETVLQAKVDLQTVIDSWAEAVAALDLQIADQNQGLEVIE